VGVREISGEGKNQYLDLAMCMFSGDFSTTPEKGFVAK